MVVSYDEGDRRDIDNKIIKIHVLINPHLAIYCFSDFLSTFALLENAQSVSVQRTLYRE